MSQERPVGLTQDQGWQIGVRRTFAISTHHVRHLLTTQPGLGYWLGTGVEPPFRKGMTYATAEGTTGDIRSYSEGSLIRLRWQPPGWAFETTLQIRVQPAKTGATISFHHERLESADQREQMRRYWSDVLDRLAALAG